MALLATRHIEMEEQRKTQKKAKGSTLKVQAVHMVHHQDQGHAQAS